MFGGEASNKHVIPVLRRDPGQRSQCVRPPGQARGDRGDLPYLNFSTVGWKDFTWRTVLVEERITMEWVVMPPRTL